MPMKVHTEIEVRGCVSVRAPKVVARLNVMFCALVCVGERVPG